MSSAAQQRYTVDQYQQHLQKSEQRLEYYFGEIFAMPGGMPNHAQISTNMVGALHSQLRGKPCRVLIGDQTAIKLHDSMYSFADALVVCGEPHYEERLVSSLINPRVIVEVLSPSSEKYDRGTKFENYKLIPSCKDYLLVSQDRPQIEYWHRDDFEQWQPTTVSGLDAVLELKTIDCRLPLAEIYEHVMFDGPKHSQKFPIRGDEE
jgi:Uma2 family endonuclease